MAIEGDANLDSGVIDSWFTFETAVSRGKGHIRLKDGKCWTLLTTMRELKGFEEKRGATRPKGVQHGVCPIGKAGLSERLRKRRNWAIPRNLTVSLSVEDKVALRWEQD